MRERGPLVAIEHVTVIDGTGAVPRTNQTLLIDHDRIAAIGADGTVRLPEGTRAIDGRGKTVIPGLVGMHEHMFRPASIDGPFIANEMFVTFPQLYLASGVTTARTGGSTDPYGDLGIRREIEAGRMELELSSFHLPNAISNAMTLVRERAQRHGIQLGVEMDPSLGELQADERKVKQILLNLLSNAVKFTPDGGKVDVLARKRDGKVEIASTYRKFPRMHPLHALEGRWGSAARLPLDASFLQKGQTDRQFDAYILP